MQVAIDGPAGSGKSTVAHALAERCGLTFLDTGAMYRALTVEAIAQGIALDDEDALVELAKSSPISFGLADDGTQTVFIAGKDVTDIIRTPEIDKSVTPVSACAAVREALVAQQRALGEGLNVVAEGRDIGTVVFPHAEVKIFLTADPAARAHRRAVQRQGGDTATGNNTVVDTELEQSILADIQRRDEADSTRAASPLKPAEDAHHIDSSYLSVDEVINTIIGCNETLQELAQAQL